MMIERMLEWETKLMEWAEGHTKIIFWDVAFGIVVYFMMISENLVNSIDGIWRTSRFVAGAWETSIGRGLLYFFDKLRSGLVSMSLNSVLTIFLISLSACLCLDLFPKIGRGRVGLLASLVLIASPVTGIILSHCYMSVDFGLAFLFSVVAVRCIYDRRKIGAVLSGGCFIAMSMGCYQAYFGVTCLLLWALLIKKLIQVDDAKEIKAFIIRSILSIAVGGIFYTVMAKVLLMRYGIGFSDYKGTSEVSLRNIVTSLPTSIVRCYRHFYYYFFKQRMYILDPKKSFVVLLGLGMLLFFCLTKSFLELWRKNRIYAICFLVCIDLLPMAVGVIILIAVGNDINLLMSMSMAACPIFCLLLCLELMPKGKISFWAKRAGVLLLFLLLWVEVLTVTNDQLALKEGTTATKEIADMIINELVSEGYMEDENIVAIMGRPSENRLFAKRSAWNIANTYARFGGEHWLGSHLNLRSWKGFLAERCGVQLNFCSEEQYRKLIQTKELSDMPCFPIEGSIRKIDGIVVVKVSAVY